MDIPRPNPTNVTLDANNPGALTVPGNWSETKKKNYAKQIGAMGTYRSPNGREYYVFASPEDGARALRADIDAKVNGGSAHTTGDTTLAQFQRIYVGHTNKSYLGVLMDQLGVPANTKLSQIDPGKLSEAVALAE